MLDLLLLVVVVAFLTWLLLLIPAVKPFGNIVMGIAITIIVFAALKVIFGLDILAHTRALFH